MDLATIAGLILAWGALLASLMIEGGRPGDLILISPAILVFGGTLGATCMTVSIQDIVKLPMFIKLGMFGKPPDSVGIVNVLTEFAKKARREGILGLEEDSKQVDNKFLRRGVEMVVDGTPADLIREILETEIAAMMQRHSLGAEMMATAGGFAPTMGIIGTVMGLIHMLKSLSDPGKMGPAIAAAFLATLYGVLVANLFFLPMGNKLKLRSQQEAALYEMMIEGILAVQSGDNPRIVEMKMTSFLPPALRGKVAAKETSPGGAADSEGEQKAA